MTLPSRIGHNETGSVLVVGMLTLVLLTLIGVAATTNGSLESEISGNEKSYQQAFYAAELGLMAGETAVEAFVSRADLNEDTIPGRYATGSLSFDYTTYKLVKSTTSGNQTTTQPLQWNSTDSTAMTNVPNGLNSVATAPRYTLEERYLKSDSLGRGITYGVSGIAYFNVTARGTGGGNAAHVLLETVYAKRF
jgi:type IV pilus assembly protein PilX